MERAKNQSTSDIVIITGVGGAGRTEAMHAFEDLGFYVIDNLPPAMILQLAEVVGITSHIGRRLAVVCDLRSQGLFEELAKVLEELCAHGLTTEVLYLDCDTNKLVKRYAFSRRKNPLANENEALKDTIEREKRLLSSAKAQAKSYIDTTDINPHELHGIISKRYATGLAQNPLAIEVVSFGYRYEYPSDADIVMDVRFLPNPYWVESLKDLTGQDRRIQDYVLKSNLSKQFLKHWEGLLDVVAKGFLEEGRPRVKVAIGCTGGKHRSVCIAEKTAEFLENQGFAVSVEHTCISRQS